MKGSAAAIKAGERACAGRSPLQVKQKYFPLAIRNGGLAAGSEEAKAIARIAGFEKAASDSSFASGQLAADAYQATLPETTARFGYQGCVYALARRLERRLAPQG